MPVFGGGGGASGALTQISATVLGAAGPTIDLTSIPQTYNHLKLEAVLRSATAAEVEFAVIRFNNDSGANYDQQLISASAAAASAGETLAATSFSTFFAYIAAANSAAGLAGIFSLDIPLYAGTTFRKTCRLIGGYQDTTSGNDRANYTMGNWRSTAAVNRITLTLASAANFVIGSAVYLYGVT